MSLKAWAIAALVVLAVAAAAYAAFENHLGRRLREDYDAFKSRRSATEQEATRVLGEVQAKDQAIIGLSRRVQDLSDQADGARRRANEAEARGAAAAGRAAQAQAEISRLQALAASRPALDTRGRAIDALCRADLPRGCRTVP